MHISGSLIRPISLLPADQQPVRDRSAADSAQVVQSSGASESNLTLRPVGKAMEAESMLFRSRLKQTAHLAQDAVDSRSQRALSAYAALQQTAEREYVSSVLGIDEYV